MRRNWSGWVPPLLFIAAALCAHGLVSLAATAYAEAAFTIRAPNIRLMDPIAPTSAFPELRVIEPAYDEADKYTLLAAYVAERFSDARPEQRRILFVGSSLTWSYPYDERLSIPARFAGLVADSVVASASVIGATQQDSTRTLCELARADVEPDLILIEIAIINNVNGMVNKGLGDFDPGPACDGPASRAASYDRYFFARPWGVPLAMLLRDEYAGVEEASHDHTVPELYRFAAEDVMTRRDLIRNEFRKLKKAALAFGAPVLFFFSPIHIPAYDDQGFDTDHIRAFVRLVEEACQGGPGDQPACLGFPTAIAEVPENFANVSHLNGIGAQRLAEALASAARPLLQE